MTIRPLARRGLAEALALSGATHNSEAGVHTALLTVTSRMVSNRADVDHIKQDAIALIACWPRLKATHHRKLASNFKRSHADIGQGSADLNFKETMGLSGIFGNGLRHCDAQNGYRLAFLRRFAPRVCDKTTRDHRVIHRANVRRQWRPRRASTGCGRRNHANVRSPQSSRCRRASGRAVVDRRAFAADTPTELDSSLSCARLFVLTVHRPPPCSEDIGPSPQSRFNEFLFLHLEEASVYCVEIELQGRCDLATGDRLLSTAAVAEDRHPIGAQFFRERNG